MKNVSISVILPTFNEQGNIKKLIKRLVEILRKEKKSFEIIVVDDNSPDKTAQTAQKLAKKFPIKTILRKRNPGLATSIKRGIREANGSVIVIMDTDFNHKPSDVPRLLTALEETKSDLVIGSRYVKGGGMVLAEVSKTQFVCSKIFNTFVINLLDIPINETLSGFIVVRKKVLEKLNLTKIFQGYGDYCIRLVYAFHKRGYRIGEIPVIYGKRGWGSSKTKLFKHSVDYLLTAISLKIKGI